VFWESSADGDVRRIILTEKPIDAMSYHQLRGAEGPVQYISTEGPLQPAQLAKLKQVIADHAGRQRDRLVVVAAVGNSRDGAGLAREVQAIVPAGVHLERAAPEIRGTWNDRLQAKERDYIRSQGVRQMGRGLERER